MTKNTLCSIYAFVATLISTPCALAQEDAAANQTDTTTSQTDLQLMSDELQRLVDLMESNAGTKEAINYCDSAYVQAQKEGYQQICNYALSQKMTNYHFLGEYEQTIFLADSIINMHKDDPKSAYNLFYATYLKIVTYIEQNKFKAAIQLAQKMYEDSKNINQPSGNFDSRTLYLMVRCNSLMGLGLANSAMDRQEDAIKSFSEGIELAKEDTTSSHNLLGQEIELETYRMQAAQKLKNRRLALSYIENYDKELESFDKVKIGTPFENIFIEDYKLFMHNAYADIFTDLGRLSEAEQHLKASNDIMMSNSLADETLAELNLIRAKYYDKKGDFKKAITYADSAAMYYGSVNKLSDEVISLRAKMNAAHKMGMHNAIYPVASKILQLTDTINEQRYNSQIEDMQTVMNVDKLEQKTQILETENELNAQKAAAETAQKQLIIAVSLIVLILGVIGFLLFKRKRDAEKAKMLSEQKKLLEDEVERQTLQIREQRDEIALKNRDITDSINYALRIQQSILPNLDSFNGYGTGGAFAFYLPCNIVSGDFYWATSYNNVHMFACADCTGHGVPGAFVSLIGTTILNDLCGPDKPIPTPSDMLENLHERLLGILQQNGEDDSRDGMDLALVIFNEDLRTASFAAARRPVYVYKGGEMLSFKGTKRSIGERDYNRENMPFTTETVSVGMGDTIYLSSDGLPDQFGGPSDRGKRLKNSGMERMMEQIVGLAITDQKKAVSDFYWEWRGQNGQLDDISFMGIRF